MSAYRWIRRMWYIHAIECYSTIKKSEFIACRRKWMQVEIILVRKMSHMFSFICGP